VIRSIGRAGDRRTARGIIEWITTPRRGACDLHECFKASGSACDPQRTDLNLKFHDA
jgi:hypothetical protein